MPEYCGLAVLNRSIYRTPVNTSRIRLTRGHRCRRPGSAACRELHGISQRELAKRAGVSNATISLIEQNRASPSVGSLKKVLDGIPMKHGGILRAGRAAATAGLLRGGAIWSRSAGDGDTRRPFLPPDRPRPERPVAADPARTLRTRRRHRRRPCCVTSPRKAESSCAAMSRSPSAPSAACSAPATPTISTAASPTASATSATRTPRSSAPAPRRHSRSREERLAPHQRRGALRSRRWRATTRSLCRV